MPATLPLLSDELRAFLHDEGGAQVVEYALIIAVVSIALILALRGLSDGSFSDLIARTGTCLKTGTCS